jgi:hypothetical protein
MIAQQLTWTFLAVAMVACDQKPTPSGFGTEAQQEIDKKAAIERETRVRAEVAAMMSARAAAESTPAETEKTMLDTIGTLRGVEKKCRPPRERELTPACMETLRNGKEVARAGVVLMDTIRKDFPGWFDLGMAANLTANCCNCAAQDAKLCDEVRRHLDLAEKFLKEKK